VVRVGLLSQPEVIDVLNRYFVPVEYDVTAANCVPGDIPAMSYLKRAWEGSPWTRVSFGSEWVLEPGGQFLLSTGFHKHTDLPVAKTFQDSLETALKRFARLRAHPRGSPEERAEVAQIESEIQRDMKELRPCWLDFRIGTQETLAALGHGEPRLFEQKLSGVFTYPDPKVRRQVAEALGAFIASEFADTLTEDQAFFLEQRVAQLLTDEDADVRQAAALAMYQFEGRPAPEEQGDPLVEAALGLWAQRETAAE